MPRPLKTLRALAVALLASAPQAMAQDKPADPALLARGEYLARAGDCIACHTAREGKVFAGGLAMKTPFGTLYTSNITPDPQTGIGTWTSDQFYRMMHDGRFPDGGLVYPAMPFASYSKVTREDSNAIFAYLRSIPPVRQPNRPHDLTFPFNNRSLIIGWRTLFFSEGEYKPDPGKSADWNRGAYLVQGLGHCGTCHTPRGLALQEKDLTGHSNEFLAGGVLAGFSSTNLRSNNGSGLGSWTEQDVVDLLKTGRSSFSAVHGPMTEVVQDSTQYMSDGDLKAIAVYLKSLSPAPSDAEPGFEKSDATIQAFMDGSEKAMGGRIFMDSCSACHRLDGSGAGRGFPRLAGNASVLNLNADSLIAIILQGNRLPSTEGAPSALAMPPFGWRYNDAEIAELATFVRTSWGNQAPAVREDDVRRVRAQLSADQLARRAASARD